jgi:hypothetical protein
MHPRLAAAKQADAMTAMQEKLPVIEQNQIAMQAQLDRIEALLKSAVEAEPEAAPEKPASKKADKA